MVIAFREYDKFKKDFKKLQKRYSSLDQDFLDFKKILELNPTGNKLISGLGEDITLPVYKVKKFACRSLKSTSQLRLIYVYDEGIGEIELIEFIEIYAKADKEIEDRDRIKKYFIEK